MTKSTEREIKERAKSLYSYTVSDYGDDDDAGEYRLDYKSCEGYISGALEQQEIDYEKFESDKILWKNYSDWLHRKYFNLDDAEEFWTDALRDHMSETQLNELVSLFKIEMREKLRREVEQEELYQRSRINETLPDEDE